MMWLFSVYMNGVIKKLKSRTQGEGDKMVRNEKDCLCTDNAVVFTETEKKLLKIVN